MKLDNSNSLEDNKKENHFLIKFMEEVQNVFDNFMKSASSRHLENSIYIIRDINDEKLSLVNIDNGQEIDIYVAHSKEKIENPYEKQRPKSKK